MTEIAKCYYNKSFSLEYEYYEKTWVLKAYYTNGNEDQIEVCYDMLSDLADLGEAMKNSGGRGGSE